jgi:chemosensory pili system protein ChpA (sensor histidine kinase/response regulator)
MRGVLSVLGMDQASQAVLHMRDNVDALAQTEVDPQHAHAVRHLRAAGRQPRCA